MDIATRLKIFMHNQNISSSQFADACKISRPTLSQLLTGRNKKVNNEIISKIHLAYPSLSIMWLMFGEPPMRIEESGADVALGEYESANVSNIEESDFVQEDENSAKSDNKIIFGSDDSIQDIDEKTGGDLKYTLRNIMRNNHESAPMQDGNAESESGKHIVSVMVLYSDNSFETFVPNK